MASPRVPRRIADSALAALADTPVVVVNGARQSGKSTLVSALHYPGSVEIVTLDDEASRAAAALDPRAFLQRPVDTLVIDEAQLEPTIFRAIKAEVDRDRRPGRFLLTGSSRLLSTTDLAESLVGRVEALELWPFAQCEITGGSADFPDRLFDDPASLLVRGSASRREIIERVCAGGFPEATQRRGARRTAWFRSYVDTTVESVVRQVHDASRRSELPRLLRLCAARTGQELNAANVANEFGVQARAVTSYLAHLAGAFLVHLIPAWSTNIGAKVVRRPKLVLPDSGLAAAMIGVDADGLQRPGGPLGPLLQTFVAMEVRKQLSWSPTSPALFHFRDRGGVEVDLVIERPDGRVVGLEVKATSTPRAEDFRGLRYLADRLGDRFAYGALLTMAPEATPFGPRLAALPIDSLWR